MNEEKSKFINNTIDLYYNFRVKLNKMRYAGKISNWKDERGFGFIIPIGSNEEVFVHINSFVYKNRRPVNAEMVSFEIATDTKGLKQAQRVLFAGERIPIKSASSPERTDGFIILAIIFILIVVVMALIRKVPYAVLGIYVITSIIAYLAFALDKSASKSGQWRISENTLYFLSVIGGWPGALIAQRLLHHKTIKLSFQIVFWVIVFLIFVYFHIY